MTDYTLLSATTTSSSRGQVRTVKMFAGACLALSFVFGQTQMDNSTRPAECGSALQPGCSASLSSNTAFLDPDLFSKRFTVASKRNDGSAVRSTFALARLIRPLGIAANTAATAANACDLNQDAIVNVVDVQLGVNMYLGALPCTATVEGAGVCNQDVINRIKTAALGGTCVTGPGPHNVTLTWTGSTTPNINGYNLYRAAVSGGPYTKINSSLIVGTSYVDNNVDGGQTYYYVSTAVDTNNNESTYSNQAVAVVPTP